LAKQPRGILGIVKGRLPIGRRLPTCPTRQATKCGVEQAPAESPAFVTYLYLKYELAPADLTV